MTNPGATAGLPPKRQVDDGSGAGARRRPAPPVDPASAPFWEGGRDGLLRIARCPRCRRFTHPPLPVCPACQARPLQPEAVSGRGTVWSATVCRYQFHPDLPPPYVVALVELAEQPGLRLLTSVVGCDPDAVTVGMGVRVAFEPAGDLVVPVFVPEDPADGGTDSP